MWKQRVKSQVPTLICACQSEEPKWTQKLPEEPKGTILMSGVGQGSRDWTIAEKAEKTPENQL